jgi:hypothetical protein
VVTDTWTARDAAGHTTTATASYTVGASSGDVLPSYSGYTLNIDVPLDRDYGWTHAQGKEHISAAYCDRSHTVFGPGGLVIQERKRSTPWMWNGYSIWSDSADLELHKADCILPNYFRARLIYWTTHAHDGLFPAFWFKPEGAGEGEIDWYEFLGGHIDGGGYINKVTCISTPYNGGASINQDYTNKLDYTKIGKTDLTGPLAPHVYEIEKAPGSIKTWVDGVLMTTHTPGGTGSNGSGMTASNWNRCFEVATQRWYFRFTGQLEDDVDGSPKGNAGTLPASWTQTDLHLERLTFWRRGT